MKSHYLIAILLAFGLTTALAMADDKTSDTKQGELAKATFLITGLH